MVKLHPDFEKKEIIKELEFGVVLFEDNSLFPWIILTSKKGVKNMLGLTFEERIQLMKELELCEQIMQKVYSPEQLNIAIFGNKTPWLHAHIIARRIDDATWPRTAFEISPKPYSLEEKRIQIKKIKNCF